MQAQAGRGRGDASRRSDLTVDQIRTILKAASENIRTLEERIRDLNTEIMRLQIALGDTNLKAEYLYRENQKLRQTISQLEKCLMTAQTSAVTTVYCYTIHVATTRYAVLQSIDATAASVVATETTPSFFQLGQYPDGSYAWFPRDPDAIHRDFPDAHVTTMLVNPPSPAS